MVLSGTACLSTTAPGLADYQAFYKAAADSGFIFGNPVTAKTPTGAAQAKARAAQRGETLKALLTRAVVTELGHPHERSARARVDLPLLGKAGGYPPVSLTAADLERALADAEALRAGRGLTRGR